ncbi:MAG: hypothetical protein A2V62_06820 [Nitrospirae bacterium RBG_19FT_COMBO_58_9]|nr:MAG: hypothetical protein A2V62_06820 [Nitrospirae bacterium RBG_19FT_COMBO_58_9]
MINSLKMLAAFGLVAMLGWGPAFGEQAGVAAGLVRISLAKVHIYLAAADYRRALEVCQKEIDDAPSVEAYVHLTYVFHAMDAYLDHLSQEERWVAVEQLYLNLAYKDAGDLIDPPGGLARMAKEMIQTGIHQQSDVSAAMATRLNKSETERLWQQQTQWRQANPQMWWTGIPDAWR